jgi:hypothetical protein
MRKDEIIRPRLEVLAMDTPWRLILKVMACRWSTPVRDRVLSALAPKPNQP